MEETKALQLFSFEEQDMQVVAINEEPWWIASEVCKVLGLTNVSLAINGNEKTGDLGLDEDEKLLYGILISGQHRQVWLVNEPGLYHLIWKSRKPEGTRLRRWVKHEVLPAIRKTGSYSVPAMQPATNITQLETIVTSLLEEVAQLRLLIKPKARPVSLIKESARARVFRCHQKLEAKKNRPITARDISRYCSKIPVELIRRYLEEYVQQGVLQAVPTIHTIKYSSIKID